ncbi:MAG: redox-sensing transcriptional repressor Rex [Bacteroidales bacterium]|nr:redox-sensing transcriptional repressor Rex [Bacteroidales bacterium]MCF8328583.1 redox-sensing transcriptional repressor Rex [Bacteroidales bacterium]
MKKLPEKTVERLSQYRRILLKEKETGKTHIFSHELANLLHITPVQVRRDIMLIGHTGTLRKGYEIDELVRSIGDIIDCKTEQKVAIIGAGNLGKAIMGYLKGKRTKLTLKAAFDVNPDKVGRVISGIRCYHIDEMKDIIQKENITIAILTVPGDQSKKVADECIQAGIKGIMNYTPTPINVQPHAYLEEYDMITSIEKVAFFSKG